MRTYKLNLIYYLPLFLISFAVPVYAHNAEAVLSPCFLNGISDKLMCGKIEVLENPKLAQSHKIPIHFVILPAIKNTNPDEAILGIAGGPGQSAIENAAFFKQILAKANRYRDILLIDQRGTGQSNLLSCDNLTLTETLALNDEDIDTATETRLCKQQLNADINQYNSVQALADFEAVRTYLGYKKLHLYGVSYGTRMAQLYMKIYPNALKTVTLDGVVPMQKNIIAVGDPIARAMSLVISDCQHNPSCHKTYPNLNSSLTNTLDNLKNHPVTATISHPVTGEPTSFTLTSSKLLSSIRLALYNPATRALIPYTIEQAAQQNYQPLLGLISVSVGSTGIADGMQAAVICSEDWPRLTDEDRQRASLNEMSKKMIDNLDITCPIWDVSPKTADIETPVVSDIPTLLLSGENDPATPPAWGEQAMETLSHARHFISPYATHGVAAQTCGSELITKLIESGNVANLDGTCMDVKAQRGFYLNASTVEAITGKTND